MAKFMVHLNAHACKSYTIEADSALDAYKTVMEEYADISEVEGSDWDYNEPGFVENKDTAEEFDINDL